VLLGLDLSALSMPDQLAAAGDPLSRCGTRPVHAMPGIRLLMARVMAPATSPAIVKVRMAKIAHSIAVAPSSQAACLAVSPAMVRSPATAMLRTSNCSSSGTT
jgi:hypothetical protein